MIWTQPCVWRTWIATRITFVEPARFAYNMGVAFQDTCWLGCFECLRPRRLRRYA